MKDLWYKNSIVYCVDVDTFYDSDGDGIGDFQGLTKRLDYLAGLGVTCVWLLPFYPTPNRDNGYDVTDYYAVDPRLGSLGDFVEFTRQAHERGIRLIVDLVVNHTSDEHPWFQAARQDPNSKYRDYYLWTDEPPPGAQERVVFPGVQESTWSYDEAAGAYYNHRFYKHQPDLNISNPDVREEICKIMGFWLALGVSGFRVDAAPFLIELHGQKSNQDPFSYLREMREFLSWRRGDAILLAEANVGPDVITKYFGDGDKMHMLFNFLVNQQLFLSLAREQAGPLVDALGTLPPIPATGQWANFLRNHDELDLGRLSDADRAFVFERYAPDERAIIYDRGIRRRLAPMLEGDRAMLELAYSLLYTLPGTPVLWYGEEIGMGDDLSLNERNSVRTPMQWSGERTGGFSTAPDDKLARPVIDHGQRAYTNVNVAAQQRESGSLLNWMERAVRTRKNCHEFGWGDWELLETGNPAVVALRYTWHTGVMVAVHNLGAHAHHVALDLGDGVERVEDLFGDAEYEPLDPRRPHVALHPRGYRWLRVHRRPQQA